MNFERRGNTGPTRCLLRPAPSARTHLSGLLVVLLSCLATLVPTQDALAAGKRCGEIARTGEFATTELVSVKASRRVRCRTARVVLENQPRANRRGWECHSAGNEAECEKRSRRVSYGSARSVRPCGSIAFQRRTENGAGSIVTRGVRCRRARAVARGSRAYGPSRSRTYRARGFRCTARKAPLAITARIFTCRKARKTVAFLRT
jgi:hypothetical protein